MNFQFDYPKSFKEELSLEHLRFFYYDVAKWSEFSQLIEMGNDELLDVASKLSINLIPIDDNAQITKPNSDEIKFKVKDSETYQSALLRHLRNSFSHFRIIYTHKDSCFYVEDLDKNIVTLSGNVKCESLRELIFHLRDYHENLTNTNPT